MVTSVGGTVGGTTGNEPEVADILSGGGFSAHFPRPNFQETDVTAFLDDFGTDTYPGYY